MVFFTGGDTLERKKLDQATSSEAVTTEMDNDDSTADVAMLMENLGGAQHKADEDPFEDSAAEDDLMGAAPEEEEEEEELPTGFDEFETIDEVCGSADKGNTFLLLATSSRVANYTNRRKLDLYATDATCWSSC